MRPSHTVPVWLQEILWGALMGIILDLFVFGILYAVSYR
jgi:hypothetical protein